MTLTRKATQSKLEIPIILLLALILAACASTSGREDKKRSETLKTSVEAFNANFKWEDYTGAVAFVPPGKKAQFWAEVDKFKGKIRIVDYQVRELEHAEMSCSATAILYFQYWRTDAPSLKTVSFSQKWYYLEKEKLWQVQDSGFEVMTVTRNAR